MMSLIGRYKYCIYLLVTATLIFGGKFVPQIGVVTDFGSTIVCIFIGVIFGYCTIGMILPSFMALIALGFSGYDTMAGIIQKSFGNATVIYIIAILILSAMLEKCGLANRLVNWLVTRKLAKGKPWVISFMFLFAAYVAALFINSIPSTIICWALLVELFAAAGYRSGDAWPMTMMFGVMYTSALGSCVPSFQISIASNYGLLAAASGGALVLNPLKYMLWSFSCSVVLFVVFFIFLKYVLHPDVSLLLREDVVLEDKTPLDQDQKITIVIFGLFVLGLLLPCILPENNAIASILRMLSDSGWGMLVVLFAITIRIKGKPLYDFGEMFSRGVIWDIVLMIATVFTLVGAITNDSTGVPQLIINVISPLQSVFGESMFLIILTLIISVLCNLTNSVAVCSVFVPVVYVLMEKTGFNMLCFVGTLIFLGNVCFLMPSASVNAAMMYNQKEWIPMKNCLFFAVYTMVSIYLGMVLIGTPIGNMIF